MHFCPISWLNKRLWNGVEECFPKLIRGFIYKEWSEKASWYLQRHFIMKWMGWADVFWQPWDAKTQVTLVYTIYTEEILFLYTKCNKAPLWHFLFQPYRMILVFYFQLRTSRRLPRPSDLSPEQFGFRILRRFFCFAFYDFLSVKADCTCSAFARQKVRIFEKIKFKASKWECFFKESTRRPFSYFQECEKWGQVMAKCGT